MEAIAALFIVAILAEAIVNIVNNIKVGAGWKYWTAFVLSIGISVFMTWNWEVDVFKILGLGSGQFPWAGAILTGVVISRGSNVLSDILGRLNSWKPAGPV